jgi:hypothetical protein
MAVVKHFDLFREFRDGLLPGSTPRVMDLFVLQPACEAFSRAFRARAARSST